MTDQRMQAFHRLVAEQRYREALGVLETADDLDPQVVEKWSRWLADLQHEERLLVGVASDKRKPAERQQATGELGQLFGQVGGLLVMTAGMVLFAAAALTTPNFLLGSGLIIALLVAGYPGWVRLTQAWFPQTSGVPGIVVTFALLFYVLTSGVPLVYYPTLPLDYVLAALALLLPAVIPVGWQVGGRFGKALAVALARLLFPPATDEPRK